jgi:electron transfer flavoprotein alpha subunit
MAFGVSGAIQHVSGIGDSDTIIAINIDRTAPMLKLADLGIVGDLHEILPILISKLEALVGVGAVPGQPKQADGQ